MLSPLLLYFEVFKILLLRNRFFSPYFMWELKPEGCHPEFAPMWSTWQPNHVATFVCSNLRNKNRGLPNQCASFPYWTCTIQLKSTGSNGDIAPNQRVTESQNHRMVGVGRDLWGHPVQPPAEAGSPRAGCTGPCPGGSGISPEKENPQPPWATCSRAPSPSEGRSSSSCSAGTSCASVCTRCPLSCRWAPMKRVWLCSLDTHPWDICKHL